MVAVLGTEVACRLHVRSGDRAAQRAWEQLEKPHLPTTGEVRLADIVRRSSDPRVLYELVPNISGVTYLGASLSTDSHGFRGPERPVDKPAKALRIVALGDSVSFGWGVEESQTMLRQLEAKLRERLTDRQVDLINTSVPGYNTVMELAALEAKGLQFHPDLVIVNFCGNDTDLPNLLPRQRSYWSLDHSYLLEMAQRAILAHRAAPDPWRAMEFDLAKSDATGKRFENDPDKVPPEYAWLVGWDNWRAAMKRIVELGREHGFRVVLLSHEALDAKVLETCGPLAVPMLTPQERIDEYLREHGLTRATMLGSELTIAANDPHPSALYNRLYFEAVWAALDVPGVFESLVPSPR